MSLFNADLLTYNQSKNTVWLWIYNSIEDRAEALVLGNYLNEATVLDFMSMPQTRINNILNGLSKVQLTPEFVNQHKLYLFFMINKIPVHLLKSGAVYLSTYDPLTRKSSEQS